MTISEQEGHITVDDGSDGTFTEDDRGNWLDVSDDGKAEDREETPLETARNLALGMRDRVQQRLTSLRAQRTAINDEIRELVEEEQRLTSMVRASEGRGGGRRAAASDE